MMREFIFLLVFCVQLHFSCASRGDATYYYQDCMTKCIDRNCTEDGDDMQYEAAIYYKQTIFDRLLMWTCTDECSYGCMWATTNVFIERDFAIPQFYGKWPFIKFLGIQEPASMIFSVMNLIVHIYCIKEFRAKVRKDSPCYKLWHLFCGISINAWIWSTIFHTRDFPWTEFMDYTSAYLIVLTALYCFCVRMAYKKSMIVKAAITVLFVSFYTHYFNYLSVGKFSYSYNMKTNVLTGILSGLGWITWSIYVRKKRPYSRLILRFYFLVALSSTLELMDFPPIFWTFDAHSFWHLSTVPVTTTFYKFIIEDCQYLRREKEQDQIDDHEKLI